MPAASHSGPPPAFHPSAATLEVPTVATATGGPNERRGVASAPPLCAPRPPTLRAVSHCLAGVEQLAIHHVGQLGVYRLAAEPLEVIFWNALLKAAARRDLTIEVVGREQYQRKTVLSIDGYRFELKLRERQSQETRQPDDYEKRFHEPGNELDKRAEEAAQKEKQRQLKASQRAELARLAERETRELDGLLEAVENWDNKLDPLPLKR